MGKCMEGHDCPSAPHGSCCGQYLCDASDLMTIYDAANILIEALHCADVEAQAIADRISGQFGRPGQPPDGVQVLEDAELLIKAALRVSTVSDGTIQEKRA